MTAQLSRERLEIIRDYDTCVTLEESAEMARMLLSGMESEPVGEVVLGDYDDCGDYPDAKVVCIAAQGQADWNNFKNGTKLYAAPPAPVSVSDELELVLKNCLNCQREHRITHYSLKDCCPHCGSYEWDIAKPLGNEQAPVAVPECFRNAVSALESLYRNGQKQCWHERYTTDMAYASGVLNACCAAMLKAGPVTAATVPDGWKLVPFEPTEAMLDAAYSHPASTEDRMRKQYVSMLAAAPQPQKAQQNIPENIPAGWTGNCDADAALVMLDRIDTVDCDDDERIESVKKIIRRLAAAPEQEV